MHRKRVTSELHDSYLRLMTIKHAIPKIERAIEWALNYHITQSRQEVRQLEKLELETRCGRESHARPKEPSGPPMSWGPEKLPIRCSKESHHPAESWAPGPPVEHQENEKDTTLTAIRVRCPWCNGYRRRNWTRRHEFKSWTDCISHRTNTLGKGINPIILPPAMGK